MPSQGAERWFHTLVVVGASLAGCGGKTATEQTEPVQTTSTGGSESSLGGAGRSSITKPSDCAYDGQFTCDNYDTLANCRCNADAPQDSSACTSPFDYACEQIACRTDTNQPCLGPINVGCYCDPSALKPTDCPTPEQFFCDHFENNYFADCMCRTPAVDLAACDFGYCCQSASPRFGCQCCPAPIR
jgi:hypothetical protein